MFEYSCVHIHIYLHTHYVHIPYTRIRRSSVADVPVGDYEVRLGQGSLARTGSDVTVVGWGAQVHVLAQACEMAAKSGTIIYIV